ncbi:MAG: nitrous oxide reductase family maturation protein NosD [Candidatus Thorarchaeota archaeon]
MKSKCKLKIIILTLGLIFAFLIGSKIYIIEDKEYSDGTRETRKEVDFISPKNSAFWPNCPRIHIKNDNWSETTLDWIQVNSGTQNDPHVIENATINAGGLGNAILIENSSDYFIIRNCTLTNSGADGNAGILLNNTLNGRLLNNTCSNNNFHGIVLTNECSNILIENSTINNNDRHGIKIEFNSTGNTVLGNKANSNGRCGIVLNNDCVNNSILNNEVRYNGGDPMGNYFGIYIVNRCNENIISGNIASNNEWYGIYLLNDCINNTISGNIAKGNFYYGILLRANSNKNKLLENEASNNRYGLGLYTCNDNIFSGNTANNNGHYGIYLRIESNNNIISENIANDNGRTGIIFDEDCDNNTISENTLYFNTEHGIMLSNTCHGNNITVNYIFYNVHYGVYIRGNSDDNKIKANYIYHNTQWGILIDSGDCNNTVISNNVIVSNDIKFINNNGNNTTLKSNYIGKVPPTFTVTIIGQTYSLLEFVIIANISSQCVGLELSTFSMQIWWNGTNVASNNIDDLGNGLYNISLAPIFVNPGEEPILLNMNISAAFHRDKYFETYIGIESSAVGEIMQIEIVENFYSLYYFNLTFFVFNETGQGINSASLQVWWNGTEVSSSVINLGNGFYTVSLESIFVSSGEDPILLNMIISATGYGTKYFETNIAIELPEIIHFLQIEIIETNFSLEHFNFTIFVCNETEYGIDSATIHMWWNSVDVSSDIINLGNGFYFVSLEPITVPPGEDPILLNMLISAVGYEEKNFEMFIAVDPDNLVKNGGESVEGFPLVIIIIIVTSIVGGIGIAGVSLFLLRRRRQASEVK